MIVSHASERFQQAEILRMFPTFLWKATVAPGVNILTSAGRATEGLDAIGRAMRIDPPYLAPYLHYLAKVQVGLGQCADAAASWEPATKRNPEQTFWNEAGL